MKYEQNQIKSLPFFNLENRLIRTSWIWNDFIHYIPVLYLIFNSTKGKEWRSTYFFNIQDLLLVAHDTLVSWFKSAHYVLHGIVLSVTGVINNSYIIIMYIDYVFLTQKYSQGV